MEISIHGYPATDEQLSGYELFEQGRNLKIEAKAGAGKTTFFEIIDKYSSGRKGLYLCFNRDLAEEARAKFSGNIDVGTAHSFAYKAICKINQSAWKRKLSPFITDKDVITYSKIGDIKKKVSFSQKLLIYGIKAIITNFLNSASKQLGEVHVSKKIHYVYDQHSSRGKTKPSEKELFIELILHHGKLLLEQMMDIDSACAATQNVYLKIWQLQEPILDYDFIMFDEAQDANPVLLSIVLQQKCQQVIVGDRYQSIYQFNGAVNALSLVPYKSTQLSNSFRYGPRIANLARGTLSPLDSNVEIHGLGFDTEIHKASNYNLGHSMMLIARTNGHLLEILSNLQNSGVTIHLSCRDPKSSIRLIESLLRLREGDRTHLPKAINHFNNWNQIIDSDDCDSETMRMVKIIDNDPEAGKRLINAIEKSISIDPQNADIILTTAHRSKGLESDCVYICQDFEAIISAYTEGKSLDQEELHLFYVALTRAKKHLILSDMLYDAIENKRPFKVIKTPIEHYLTDNLIAHSDSEMARPIIKKDNTCERVKKTESEQAAEAAEKPVTGTKRKQHIDAEGKADKSPTGATGAELDKLLDKDVPLDIAKQNATHELGRIAVKIGHDKTHNLPQYWMPTNTRKFFNPNTAILGTMGTGKTQLVKAMLLQLYQQRQFNGDREFGLLIFDYKDDYTDQEFVTATNAKVFDLVHIPINPLAIFAKKPLGTVHTASTFTSSLVKAFGLGTKQESLLKKCIAQAYETRGIHKMDISSYDLPAPTISDVYEVFSMIEKVPMDSLYSAMNDLNEYEVFCPDGEKCEPLLDLLRGNIIVIKLSGYDPSLQNLVVSLLLDQFYSQMHLYGKPRPDGDYRSLTNMILVDEADNFMRCEFPSLLKILKEGREFGVGVMLSTQGADHFKTTNCNYSDYMLAWIIHKLNNPVSKDVATLFNLDKKEDINRMCQRLRTLEKHHSLFIDTSKNIVYQESSAFWKFIKNS
ncbi:hypothetical protein ABT56_19150 [Photobacterium aquae]|uniref:DNA 3'-5' helicase n=1 Tax=Photobacterium aquae TaxID=1195763 RepID=A0A0J1GV97_9GAMM|nr:3'-5' exonuclease [Photobacterium aquae]KLV03546.1 hypothetical protein ABT56_19150 [Photobacterium aquae]